VLFGDRCAFYLQKQKLTLVTGVLCMQYCNWKRQGCAPEAEGAAGVGVLVPFDVVEEADVF
jgi:hypothetical protein